MSETEWSFKSLTPPSLSFSFSLFCSALKFAHRAARVHRAPQPFAAGRGSSPGRWGWGSAWLCQPSLGAERAGSSAASPSQRRSIRWTSGGEGEISTCFERRLNWPGSRSKAASPSPAPLFVLLPLLLPRLWRRPPAARGSALCASRNVVFALRMLGLRRSPLLALLRSSHRADLAVCWMNRASPWAWAFIPLPGYNSPSPRLCCVFSGAAAARAAQLAVSRLDFVLQFFIFRNAESQRFFYTLFV